MEKVNSATWCEHDTPCKHIPGAVPHPGKQGAAEGQGFLTQRQEALADLYGEETPTVLKADTRFHQHYATDVIPEWEIK